MSEEQYLMNEGFHPEFYEVVVFPYSQDYMGYDEEDDVHLINDEEGLELYGDAAYIIPIDLEPYEEVS